jgi:SAM-dependent methyltransferase
MDLRSYNLTPRQLDEGARVLNYQPFILSDDLQTGAAYSWVSGRDPRHRPPLVFRRAEWETEWADITDANERLRRMYDGFLGEIARRYPGGSLFDLGCNNGYFPVRAEMLGMRGCAGADFPAHHRQSIRFLNRTIGTRTRFIHTAYQPARRRLPVWRKFDVAVASAVMCHLPDPVNFLVALGSVAREAIFFWGQTIESGEMLIALNTPHPHLSEKRPFPYNFNDNTRISRGLFEFTMGQMGFREIVEIPLQPDWLPFATPPAGDLAQEIRDGSPHRAFLAMR